MFHIQKSGRFSEQRAKFYSAEISLGLQFLHERSKSIITLNDMSVLKDWYLFLLGIVFYFELGKRICNRYWCVNVLKVLLVWYIKIMNFKFTVSSLGYLNEITRH